ncbi:MAG: hypothetical protein ACYSU0_08310 [Planctomycetota bacterium]|jgi:hypothetical protein
MVPFYGRQSSITVFACSNGVPDIVMLLDRERRARHDFIANTVVIDAREGRRTKEPRPPAGIRGCDTGA